MNYFIRLQPKPWETLKLHSSKQNTIHCRFLFWLSVLLYAMISDHANICIYVHWSSTTGYGFLLKATTITLFSYFQKTNFKVRVQMSCFIKRFLLYKLFQAPSCKYLHLATKQKGWFKNEVPRGREGGILGVFFLSFHL